MSCEFDLFKGLDVSFWVALSMVFVQASEPISASKGAVNGILKGVRFCLGNLFSFEAIRNSFRVLDPWFLCRLVLGEKFRKVPLAAPTKGGGLCLVNLLCLMASMFPSRVLDLWFHVQACAQRGASNLIYVNLICLSAWMFFLGLLYLWFLYKPLNPYQHQRVPFTAPSRGGGFCHVNLFCLMA